MKSSLNNGSRCDEGSTQVRRFNSRVPAGAGRAWAIGSSRESLSMANATVSIKLGIAFPGDALVAQPIPVRAGPIRRSELDTRRGRIPVLKRVSRRPGVATNKFFQLETATQARKLAECAGERSNSL